MQRQSRQSFFYPMPILTLMLGGVLSIVTSLYDYGSFTILILIAAFIAAGALFLKNLVGGHFINATSCLCSCILIVVMLHFYDPLSIHIQAAKISLMHARYEQCISDAVEFGAGSHLGICERRDWDSWGRVDVIAYDSSDEIAKKACERSAGWVQAALSLQKSAPFGIVGFKADKIAKHFYRVRFVLTDPVSPLSLGTSC